MFQGMVRNQLHQFRSRLRSVVRKATSQSQNPLQHYWSIGIYTATSPLCLFDSADSENPVLTHMAVSDVPARFVADPFMVRADGRWSMFFEVMNKANGRGQIGLATSDDGFSWEYRRIVLAEPFHLSYPYVFEWKGEHFMIPESYQAGSVRLYKAERFPDRWSFNCSLIEGGVFSDPSVVHYEGKWWMFVESNPQFTFVDTLRLFYSDELTGPWHEHPMSPIVEGNKRTARPAGRVQTIEGHLTRFAQDCYPVYGTQVRSFVVSELTTRTYRESECPESPILGPSGAGWNRSGMHHLDLHRIQDGRWIACVDGFELKESAG